MTLLTQVANFSFSRTYLSVVVREAAEETEFSQTSSHFLNLQWTSDASSDTDEAKTLLLYSTKNPQQ